MKKIGCQARIHAQVDARDPSTVHVRIHGEHTHGVGEDAKYVDLVVRMLDHDIRDSFWL